MREIPRIYFYMHPSEMPASGVPDDAGPTWSGFIDYMRQPGIGLNPVITSYCWTLQTFLYLREAGLKCEITATIPDDGIIIVQRAALPFNFKPKPKQLIVCIKADFEIHPYAQLNVVQNPEEVKTVRDSFFIRLWLQPGLIKRDPARGNKFENIAFIGAIGSLAPELKNPSWSAMLESIGLRWLMPGEQHWHDYSNIDAIVAVRTFDPKEDYRYKPATKLQNAWLGDVPAIVGTDSAFRGERQSELDFIEVSSIDETIAALKRLRDDYDLYQAMVKNGRVRSEKLTTTSLVERWKEFITQKAIPAYYQWCELSSLQQKLWLAKQNLTVTENNLRPNTFYPYELEPVNNDHIGIQDSVMLSTIQMYRKAKKLLTSGSSR
ncbi:hypothetical protein NIES4071_82390 [Calothrix sp. NIES-4071]|nr:hypothetical protein NIES4071_82390 [Calothrix sp. NIES-4071]BAZ62508.1 hypothetical protein NIES4105_82320 [Calothrix sp. NIES-4105]